MTQLQKLAFERIDTLNGKIRSMISDRMVESANMKPRTFFFHYNKPATQRSGSPKMSIHFAGACHIVDHIVCHAVCYTHHKKTQPRCIMKGKCVGIKIITEADGKLKGVIYESNTGI